MNGDDPVSGAEVKVVWDSKNMKKGEKSVVSTKAEGVSRGVNK